MRNSMHFLFHRRTPWNEEIRCSTNIFASLALEKGHQVTYMPGTMHLGRIMKKSGNYSSWRKGFRNEDGAAIYTPMSLVPFLKGPILSGPLAADLSYSTFIPGLKKVFRQKGIPAPEVIWTVPPGSSALRSAFPGAKLIHQVVDYYPSHFGERIKKVEKQDYARADHILTIGHSLEKYMRDELEVPGEKITVLGQGVDISRFQGQLPEPEEYKGITGPIAVWVGVCNKMDRELCSTVARAMEKRKGLFMIIGPEAEWSRDFANEHKSVVLAGSRHARDIPNYLVYADIGIMLYDRSRQDVYKGQHPLKLYEYAAAGLSILATPHDEFHYHEVPAIIIEAEEQVESAIENALGERIKMKEKSLSFAESHSWDSAFQRAMDAIGKNKKPVVSS